MSTKKPKAVAPAGASARYKAGVYTGVLRTMRRAMDAAGIAHNIPAKLPKEKA